MKRIWFLLSSFIILTIIGFLFNPSKAFSATDIVQTWSLDTQLPYKISNHFSFTDSDKLYVVTGSALTYNSHDDVINSTSQGSGTLSNWLYSNNKYPKKIIWGTGAKNSKYFYGLGGYEEYSPSSHFSDNFVYYSDNQFSWSSTTPLLNRLSKGAAVVSGNYIYYSGGWTDNETSSSASKKVYVAPINTDGTLGSWQATTDLPTVLWDHAMFEHAGYVYVLGGKNGSVEVNQVIRAQINVDGALGSWTIVSTMPGSTRAFGFTKVNNYLFVVGGYNGSFLNSVFYTTVNTDGSLNPWQTSGNSLPVSNANGSLVALNGYLYFIGGYIPGYGYSERVYRAKLNLEATKTPIIFLPGMGASWNYKAIIHNANTDSTQWKIAPFVNTYSGLINSIKQSGYVENTDFFIYAYDWRKPISQTATKLKSFLDLKLPNQKVTLVGHSMGGLVARAFATNNPSQVAKLLTVASPHQGSSDVYWIWEGADLSQSFANWQSLLIKLLLRVNKPYYLTEVSEIQGTVPSFLDIWPTYNFIKRDGQLVTNSTLSYQNQFLPNLGNIPSQLVTYTSTLGGINIPTRQTVTTQTASVLDSLLGLWKDGKPTSYDTSSGDGTVLATSRVMTGIADTPADSINHSDILGTSNGLDYVLNNLGITTKIAPEIQKDYQNALLITVASPVSFYVSNGVQNYYPQDGLVVIDEPTTGQWTVNLTPLASGGAYTLYFGKVKGKDIAWETATGTLTSGSKTHTFPVNLASSNLGSNPLAIALARTDDLYKLTTWPSLIAQDILRTKSYINDFKKTTTETNFVRLLKQINITQAKVKTNSTANQLLNLIRDDCIQHYKDIFPN